MHNAPLIVFANDDVIYLRIIQLVLTDAGYTNVLTVSNVEAYTTARARQPALLLLDINFGAEPEGWAALDRLTLDPVTTHIPIILCSTDNRQLQAKAAWFATHNIATLEKPFNLPDVLATIARVLADSRSE